MYKLKADRFSYLAGTVVYPYTGYDYGLSYDDRKVTGESHISVTINSDGSSPFFTVPCTQLEKQ